LIWLQVPNRVSDEVGLGMGGWVPTCRDRVLRGQHDASVHNQKGSERMVARDSSLACQFDRLPDETVVDGLRLHIDPRCWLTA
jgi:hypothetical protein